MDKYLILSLFSCMMFFYSCSEENNRTPVTSDSTVPGQVSNVHVERLPGAVKLTYDMPDGQNLSYVKAECLINGVVRQVKASSYVNHLTIDGFADSSVYTINLYSVNRSEKASEPVEIQAQPFMPPFREVFQNIRLYSAFGGAAINFENPHEADLAITIINIDSTGFWNSGETFYTKRQQGSFAVRGFDPVETRFGVYIRDRWNNYSDTLIMDLTPKFEEQLDRRNFRAVYLPSDSPSGFGWEIPFLWDGRLDEPGFHTLPDGTWPQWFTFDLGAEGGAVLSRCRFWQRQVNAYGANNPRKLEIWGSMNPNPDGSWDDSWTLLAECEAIKPSGGDGPLGPVTAEDQQAILDGDEFLFPDDIPPVRYLRIKVTLIWLAGNGCIHFVEMAYWGTTDF